MAAQTTIRERIKTIQGQMVNGAFTPALVRDNLIHLTGLFGLVQMEHREADYDYHLVLDDLTTELKAVARARIRAATTPQYQRAREASDTEELVKQMIMASKKYLESLDNEVRMAG